MEDYWIDYEERELKEKRRKMIIKNTIILATILFTVIWFSFFLINTLFTNMTSDMCRNEIISRIEQPSKAYDLIHFRRNCGATTGYSYHLSIIKHGKVLPNKPGNIYISNNDFTANWNNNISIMISTSGKDEFKKEKDYSGIQMIYK
jgi:hypothetical protein